jgi:DHA3 family multidrug efflux protein-like MFS transporter
MAGVFTLTIAFSGFFLGSLVDRYPKKRVMLLSSFASLILYSIAGFIFITPYEEFTDASIRRILSCCL